MCSTVEGNATHGLDAVDAKENVSFMQRLTKPGELNAPARKKWQEASATRRVFSST